MALAVERLARISLNSADPETLAHFYVDALGFSDIETGKPGACALALGTTRLELMRASGRPYPDDVAGSSPLFQHCAIATADMALAMVQLEKARGWKAISTSGPERLPKSSGGVVAFKFRDPEGHPLEFLEFPDMPAGDCAVLFLRIDHSAISIADTPRSIAFYESLGLGVGAHSLNVGPEQARLDATPDAEVEVTALDLPSGTKPHVELLCYRGAFHRDEPPPQLDDIAATRLVFAASADTLGRIRANHSDRLTAHDGPGLLLRDPDGHVIEIS